MTSLNTIRVLIVDDHTIVREGLVTLFETMADLALIGEASNGLEAIKLYDELVPDVILMDLMMPEMDGISAIRSIRQSHPDAAILVLTSFKEQEMVQAAIEEGALGYVLKNITADELASAIRLVSQGDPVLSPEATRALIHAATNPHAPGYELTKRELEVLALLVEGLSNAMIAERLMISSSTVKNHISHILSKLGVATRTEAVAFALQNKIVK